MHAVWAAEPGAVIDVSIQEALATMEETLARELNPRAVYERLFRASTGDMGDSAKTNALLLDRVMGDAKRLRADVGQADRMRLDEYLSIMRSLEERVERAGQATKVCAITLAYGPTQQTPLGTAP